MKIIVVGTADDTAKLLTFVSALTGEEHEHPAARIHPATCFLAETGAIQDFLAAARHGHDT